MFHWNMSLETGIEPVDHERRRLIEAMADFFRIIDAPDLNQKLVAERTGAIYTAMKAAFSAEDRYLGERPEDTAPHQAKHAAFLRAYVEICKKLVPRIKTVKQAQQTCLEIYRMVDTGVYPHIVDEAPGYRHMHHRPPVRPA